ncbi:MAG: iron-containing alcohol dehydrogenase [Thermoplasmata archaeon]|nr:iron-containing alcohol dehydrogenase [Thermoplasmata archaeon]
MLAHVSSPHIVVGPTALDALVEGPEGRVAIVADATVARGAEFARVVAAFEHVSATLDQELTISSEPDVATVERLAERWRTFGPATIVAVGGGSTLDAAKGAWARYARPDVPLETITPLVELGLRAKARFIAIPTTSGRGSEAAWTARFHREGAPLLEIASRELVPDLVLLDPAFPATMPPEVAAASGMDALAHAFESIASAWANPFSDALARDAIATIVTALPRIHRRPDDADARSALHAAATMAGLACANAQLGVGHALTDGLASTLRIPHARAMAVLLPYVLEFNQPVAREQYGTLTGVLGAGPLQSRFALGNRIRTLQEAVGVPRQLSQLGVDATIWADAIDEVAARASTSSAIVANPRVPSNEELHRLLEAAYSGRPIDF